MGIPILCEYVRQLNAQTVRRTQSTLRVLTYGNGTGIISVRHLPSIGADILCRLAFCLSLAEPTPPTSIDIPADSNVEMTWHVFGGECHELYLAALKERCVRDRLDTLPETVNRQFRLHLHRGISYLATPNKIRSIGDLMGLVR